MPYLHSSGHRAAAVVYASPNAWKFGLRTRGFKGVRGGVIGPSACAKVPCGRQHPCCPKDWTAHCGLITCSLPIRFCPHLDAGYARTYFVKVFKCQNGNPAPHSSWIVGCSEHDVGTLVSNLTCPTLPTPFDSHLSWGYSEVASFLSSRWTTFLPLAHLQ